jgi:hypothetical protein
LMSVPWSTAALPSSWSWTPSLPSSSPSPLLETTVKFTGPSEKVGGGGGSCCCCFCSRVRRRASFAGAVADVAVAGGSLTSTPTPSSAAAATAIEARRAVAAAVGRVLLSDSAPFFFSVVVSLRCGVSILLLERWWVKNPPGCPVAFACRTSPGPCHGTEQGLSKSGPRRPHLHQRRRRHP